MAIFANFKKISDTISGINSLLDFFNHILPFWISAVSLFYGIANYFSQLKIIMDYNHLFLTIFLFLIGIQIAWNRRQFDKKIKEFSYQIDSKATLIQQIPLEKMRNSKIDINIYIPGFFDFIQFEINTSPGFNHKNTTHVRERFSKQLDSICAKYKNVSVYYHNDKHVSYVFSGKIDELSDDCHIVTATEPQLRDEFNLPIK